MQYSVTFRHMEPSETLKEYSYDKLLRLEKFLDAVIDAEVVLGVSKFRHKAEVIISSDGLKIKAEEEMEDMYSAIDAVVDKLEKQIKRHRSKLKDHKSKRAPHKDNKNIPGNYDADHDADHDENNGDAGDEIPIFDRHQTVVPEKMTLEEAGAQLASGTAHQVIFINRDDGRISILKQNHGSMVELITIDC